MSSSDHQISIHQIGSSEMPAGRLTASTTLLCCLITMGLAWSWKAWQDWQESWQPKERRDRCGKRIRLIGNGRTEHNTFNCHPLSRGFKLEGFALSSSNSQSRGSWAQQDWETWAENIRMQRYRLWYYMIYHHIHTKSHPFITPEQVPRLYI